MQPLLAPGSGLDWHSAVTAGIGISFKLLCDERVFASDATCFTDYSPMYLVHIEHVAMTEWLPKLAHIHALVLHFRTSLLDLALETPFASAPTLTDATILVIEMNDTLRAEYEAVARAVAPNATIVCTNCYLAARAQTRARIEASLPVHLILVGTGVDEAVPAVRVRAMNEFSRAVDPRKGAISIDMYERPLLFAVSLPTCADLGLGRNPTGLRTRLRRAGVDAVLPSGHLTAPALLTLLDFISEGQLHLDRACTRVPGRGRAPDPSSIHSEMYGSGRGRGDARAYASTGERDSRPDATRHPRPVSRPDQPTHAHPTGRATAAVRARVDR